MKSYLKFLSRNALYTAIEAVGLAVSLAFVILIGSYVVQQYRVAHENPDWKRIYALGADQFLGLSYWDKEELEMAVPEVEAVTRLALLTASQVEFSGELVQGGSGIGLTVDPEFFDIFPYYEIKEGSVDAFCPKDAVLVTESMAARLRERGGADLIGQPLRIGDEDHFIAGVVQDFEGSVFPKIDLLTNIGSASMATQEKAFNSVGSYSTLYRVRKDVTREEADAKVKAVVDKNYRPIWGDQVDNWGTWRLDEVFFSAPSSGIFKHGNKQTIRLLTLVVFLLLLSAVINYVNLSFALGGKRAKEMATRRLLGEDRSGIIWKQIGESVAFTAVCFAVALLLAYLLVPMMNDLLSTRSNQISMLEEDVRLQLLFSPGYVAAYLLGILVLGAVCGLLPAWAAARYEPVDAIKGSFRRNNKMVFSKVFIVIQNALAVFLIAMALVMEVQMKHMLRRPTHAQVDDRYYLEYYATDYDQMKLLKDKVEQLPFVKAVGVGKGLPGKINMFQTVSLDDGTRIEIPVILCDSTYFRLLGLEVVDDFHHPLLHSIWLDESAFQAAGVSDSSTVFPRKFGINGAKADYIGGVFRDIPYTSASTDDERTQNAGVIVSDPKDLYFSHALLIETFGEDKDYETRLMKAYEDYRLEQYGTYEAPWTHGFLRDLSRIQLAPARRTMRLLELFMVLSVLIALLGLLAMSTYFAGENTKQIAIRKVFGADISGETWRNVRSYMILVGIACLIGIPLAIWASRLYLQRFAYRVEGYGWVFLVAVLISLAIAFGTVLWQTLKAARTNPAVELKKE